MILVIIGPYQIHAQTAILQGVVTDSESQSAIPFATIALYQQGILIEGTDTDFDGNYLFANLTDGVYDVKASFLGYTPRRIEGVIVKYDSIVDLDLQLEPSGAILDEVVITRYKKTPLRSSTNSSRGSVTSRTIKALPLTNISRLAATTAGLSSVNGSGKRVRGKRGKASYVYIDGVRVKPHDAKQLKRKAKTKKSKSQLAEQRVEHDEKSIGDYGFTSPLVEPLSTLSIDVDRASYSNIRGYLNRNMMPPTDAVRVEEMVNYFSYDYKVPTSEHPFNAQTTLTDCPWNKKHKVLHVALQATEEIDLSNKKSQLVFLVDVSGSMSSHNKLPLVIESMQMLVNRMNPDDRVAIVTYAGSSRVVLPSTPISNKDQIMQALSSLTSGGSTAGAQGINTAYQIAEEYYIKNGNNRVILATDGDFNVGVSSDAGLVDLIEEKRESGIFLSVLGYGYGNYQDHKMQMLANKGNGNHAYIDSRMEANKILIREYTSTLYTIAKDVKIQIEFNPNTVQSYKLIGYENRRLNPEDFNNDSVDAGEMGGGHTVTALFEIIPTNVKSKYSKTTQVDPLIYQSTDHSSHDIGWLKMRYKLPKKSKSIKLESVIDNTLISDEELNGEIRYSLGVAECGLLLSQSPTAHHASYDNVLTLIEEGLQQDAYEERAEFKGLVEKIQQLTSSVIIE